jgi:hypothetical protein
MPRKHRPVQNEDRRCTYCNKVFTPKNILRSYCYEVGCKREHKRLVMRAYNAMVKERDGISPTQKIRPRKSIGQTCTICGEELERVGASDRPMHKKCRTRRTPGMLHKRFQEKADRAAAGTTGGSRVFVAGGCAWCGEYFVAAAGVYCDDKCKRSAKFKRRSSGMSFTVSPLERRKIYDRDNWTCQICHHPVDPSVKYPSQWAPSLDHIEPQSATLIPDHSPSNLRLAHLWCNSARGDGSNMAKEVLIARVTAMHLEAA